MATGDKVVTLDGLKAVFDYQEAETSALKSSVNWVTPELYGAVGDGETDDTLAIQTAFNTGFSILFSKKYLCGSINVSGINGANYFSINDSFLTGNTNINFSNCSDILLDNIHFKNCTHNNKSLYFSDCDSVTIRNCSFYNLTYSAIVIGRTSTQSISRRYIITDCSFINVNTSETWGGGIFWDGLEEKPIYDVNVTNCHFENVGCVAVNSGGCVGLNVSDNICEQNNNGFTSTMGLLSASRESEKIIVSNNIINSTEFEGVILNRISNALVNGNCISNCKHGIAIENSSSECIVSDNLIVNCNYGAIITDSSLLRFQGNDIIDSSVNGIYIDYGTQNIEISNNSIKSTAACITGRTSTEDHKTTDIKVISNTLESQTDALVAIMHSGIYIIENNKIKSPSTYFAISLKRPLDVTDYCFNVNNNIVLTECAGALRISDVTANQANGVIHYVIKNNDFSKCDVVYVKDANARILALSFAENRKTLTPAEAHGYFDRNSIITFNGLFADLIAALPSPTYVMWQIGCVVKCNDTFAHVTRGGNPATGSTVQYTTY